MKEQGAAGAAPCLLLSRSQRPRWRTFTQIVIFVITSCGTNVADDTLSVAEDITN